MNTVATRPDSSAKPKVCFVHLMSLPVLAKEYNHYPIGGEAVQHTLLAKALAKRGYPVSMIVADYGQPDGAVWDGIKTLRAYRYKAGIPILRFIYPRCTTLWQVAKKADADVYYVSCAGMIVGLLAFFARRYNRKLIYRVAHDSDCAPKRLLIPNYRDKKIYEYGLRRADLIFAQSVVQQKMLKENYGVDSRVARMLLDRPQRILGYNERDISVLWVNNIRPFKRPQLVLELAQKLADVGFHMIGGPAASGYDKLFNEIKDKATSLDNLSFHGAVPYHDVNGYFERTRVFINTSESEGFPNSFLQAWARGVPIVSFFDPDGIIRKYGLGKHVSTLNEMADAIKELLCDPEKWQETSQRCLTYMDENYNEDEILEPYIKGIHELTR